MLAHMGITIITVIGIKKNAIMMIDFAIEVERDEGLPRATPSTRRACSASAHQGSPRVEADDLAPEPVEARRLAGLGIDHRRRPRSPVLRHPFAAPEGDA
jgi:hypothetical protein